MSCNAEVEVLYAYDLSSITSSEFGFGRGSSFFSSSMAKTMYDIQDEAFNKLAERNGIPAAQRHLIMGNPAKVLASYADAYDIDVIVMGRVSHRGLGRLIGSTAEHLLYKMPCSMLVVSPEQLED